MKHFKVHYRNTEVSRLNNNGLLLQIGFCSFESCLVFMWSVSLFLVCGKWYFCET